LTAESLPKGFILNAYLCVIPRGASVNATNANAKLKTKRNTKRLPPSVRIERNAILKLFTSNKTVAVPAAKLLTTHELFRYTRRGLPVW
jgi:hypothetical protein